MRNLRMRERFEGSNARWKVKRNGRNLRSAHLRITTFESARVYVGRDSSIETELGFVLGPVERFPGRHSCLPPVDQTKCGGALGPRFVLFKQRVHKLLRVEVTQIIHL